MTASVSWLGVECPLEEFIKACRKLGVTIEIDDTAEDYDDFAADIGETDTIEIVGAREFENQTYIIGEAPIICSDADLMVDLSRELDGKVVGGCVVPGCYYSLHVAQMGRLIRIYRFSSMFDSQPFEKCQPLPCEGLVPLDRPDGEGVIVAFTSFGFDFEAAFKEGPYHTLSYSPEEMHKKIGPLTREISEYEKDIRS
jgi:hypothetical protein